MHVKQMTGLSTKFLPNSETAKKKKKNPQQVGKLHVQSVEVWRYVPQEDIGILGSLKLSNLCGKIMLRTVLLLGVEAGVLGEGFPH